MKWILLIVLALLMGFNGLMLRDVHSELNRFIFVFVDYIIFMFGVYLVVLLARDAK